MVVYIQPRAIWRICFRLSNTGAGENYNDTNSYNENQKKYVFRNMSQHTIRALQDSDKNKFLLRGRYKSSGDEGSLLGHSMCQEVQLLLRQVGEFS
jgi:hypothetical protein